MGYIQMFFSKNKINEQQQEIDKQKSLIEELHDQLEQSQQENQQCIAELQELNKHTDHSVLYLKQSEILARINQKTASSTVSLNQQKSKLTEVKSLFSQSEEMLSHIAQSNTQLSQQADSSKENIDNLYLSLQEIGEFTTLISSVSDQTNLLALNAAIEAARAGEHGRGFAVVADEVRTLAGRTADATHEISEVVNKIDGFSKATLSGFSELTKVAKEIDQSIANVHTVIDEVSSLSNIMMQLISGATGGSFIDTVVMDHLLYKFEVFKVINNISEKTADDFASHHQCRLGQWYYEGDGKKLVSGVPSYKKLEKPHQAVHAAGVKAIHAHFDGDVETEHLALEEMEQASIDVIAHLNELESAYQDCIQTVSW